MPELKNAKYEQFCAGIVNGLTPGEAYIRSGYKKGGAAQSAHRLLKTAQVRARLAELRAPIAAATAASMQIVAQIQATASERAVRILRLDDRLRKLDQVIAERAAAYKGKAGGKPKIPGGSTGLVVEVQKGKGTEYQVDTGTLREMRAHEQQIAVEMGQWDQKSAAPEWDGDLSKLTPEKRAAAMRQMIESAFPGDPGAYDRVTALATKASDETVQ